MTEQYSAYTETDEPFDSLERAVEALTAFPWMANRAVRAVSMVTHRDSNGITAEVTSGVATPDDASTLTYLVDVAHPVGGAVIPISYLIEFGERDNGETGEDSVGNEPGDEEAPEEPDSSSEQGGEGDGDVPYTGDARSNEVD